MVHVRCVLSLFGVGYISRYGMVSGVSFGLVWGLFGIGLGMFRVCLGLVETLFRVGFRLI